MTRRFALLSVALAAVFSFAADASAQLFGQRTVGQPLSQRPGTSATNSAKASRASAAASFSASGGNGPATGNRGSMVNEKARFIRGNRKATDFVGADTAESKRFVGREQAGTDEEVRSAVDNLNVEMAPDANLTAKPVMPPRVQMNAPRLRVAFEFAGEAQGEVNSRLTSRLEKTLPGGATNRIAVSVAGDAATVRGVVASERDRKLAELMLLFEPGIVRVQNQLQVRPAELPRPPPAAPIPAG
jgi:hypothetical protein